MWADLNLSSANLQLYDNTRTSACKTCPRLFFFRHVLDLEPEVARPALIFGGAWHNAMDIVWPRMIALRSRKGWLSKWTDIREDIVQEAFLAFCKEWEERGMPGVDRMETDRYKELAPRVPSTALEMLYEYTEIRKIMLTTGDIELIAVEYPFIVPLDPTNDSLYYCGRFDKIIKWNGRIHAVEHKTTSAYRKGGPFRASFTESFSPNSQVDGYLYSGRMEFGDLFKSVLIDAALVHPNETGFRLLPIERHTAQLDAWLWETHSWINYIQANHHALSKVEASDAYMSAFPKNTNSCISFETTCTYMDLCKMWANPLGRGIPPGFVENRWEPFEELDLHKAFARKDTAHG